MFALLKGAFGEMTRRDEYFVTILGLDGAGKSTYLEMVKRLLDKTYKGRELSKITSTVGLNHFKIQLKEIILNCWDLGGHSDLRLVWNDYLGDQCSALIFILDCNDMGRYGEAMDSLEQIMSVEHVHGIPLLILLNKFDCVDDVTADVNGHERQHATSNGHSGGSDALASSSDWQSFDLDHEWEVRSDCSMSPAMSPDIMERIRNDFDDRFGSIHRGDFAIISISAWKNINVRKSVNWLMNSMISYRKELNKS